MLSWYDSMIVARVSTLTSNVRFRWRGSELEGHPDRADRISSQSTPVHGADALPNGKVDATVVVASLSKTLLQSSTKKARGQMHL